MDADLESRRKRPQAAGDAEAVHNLPAEVDVDDRDCDLPGLDVRLGIVWSLCGVKGQAPAFLLVVREQVLDDFLA